jgi:hypothetical protein
MVVAVQGVLGAGLDPGPTDATLDEGIEAGVCGSVRRSTARRSRSADCGEDAAPPSPATRPLTAPAGYVVSGSPTSDKPTHRSRAELRGQVPAHGVLPMGGAPGPSTRTAERSPLSTPPRDGVGLFLAVTLGLSEAGSGVAAPRAGPTGPGALPPPRSVPGPPSASVTSGYGSSHPQIVPWSAVVAPGRGPGVHTACPGADCTAHRVAPTASQYSAYTRAGKQGRHRVVRPGRQRRTRTRGEAQHRRCSPPPKRPTRPPRTRRHPAATSLTAHADTALHSTRPRRLNLVGVFFWIIIGQRGRA